MSRIRRLGFVAIMMVAMLVGGAPAFATEPLTTSASITDPEGWLDKENRARIDDYIHRAEVQGFEVRVAIVPNFSDVNPYDWCSRSLRVSEALCMRFNPQSRRRVRNNDCCVPEEA